ncbi:hypothetical protein MMC22_009205 [Lobaria immixta]|nr:hypothetical protein [Lobaria immixta]
MSYYDHQYFDAAPLMSQVTGDADVGVRLNTEICPEAKLEVDPEVDPESAVEGVIVDEALAAKPVKVDIPIVAGRTTRLFLAQHASEVKLPQQKLPSVKHCVNGAVPFVDPLSCLS